MDEQRPRAVETVHTTPVGDELMVHVVGSEETHLLSPTTTAVWHRCDGFTTRTQLESIFPDEEPVLRPELVQLALDQLERAGLIEDGGRSSDVQRESRRRFLKRAAIAAVAVPTITTIVTATPAAASSPAGGCESDLDCDPDTEHCVEGVCEPKQDTGESCSDPSDCLSGICENFTCRSDIGGECPANNSAGDAHCITTAYCDGDSCQAKKPTGTAASTSGCTRSGQCQSGCCQETPNSGKDKCQEVSSADTCKPS